MKKIQPLKSQPFMQNSGPLSFYFPIFLQPVYIDFSTPSTARQPCKNQNEFYFLLPVAYFIAFLSRLQPNERCKNFALNRH